MGINHVFAALCGVVALFGDRATAKVLFTAPGPITPLQDTVLKTGIRVGDDMHYEFDLVLHSVPASGWRNIFGVFPSDGTRMPGLYIHETADNTGGQYEGWNMIFEDDGDASLGDEPLVAGNTYHFEMDWTQSSIYVKINGKTVWDASTSTHTTYESADIYMGSSELEAADATITNFVISTDLNCYVTGYECESYEVCGDDGECTFTGDCSSCCTACPACHWDGTCATKKIDAYLSECPIVDGQPWSLTVNGQSAHAVSGIADGVAPLNTESMEWTLTAKDVVIVCLLSVNVVVTVIMFIVCKTGSGGKVVFRD